MMPVAKARPMGCSRPPKQAPPHRDREKKEMPVPAAKSYGDILARVSRPKAKT